MLASFSFSSPWNFRTGVPMGKCGASWVVSNSGSVSCLSRLLHCNLASITGYKEDEETCQETFSQQRRILIDIWLLYKNSTTPYFFATLLLWNFLRLKTPSKGFLDFFKAAKPQCLQIDEIVSLQKGPKFDLEFLSLKIRIFDWIFAEMITEYMITIVKTTWILEKKDAEKRAALIMTLKKRLILQYN